MPVNIVDASLHTATFPAQYTGPGNLIGNCVQSAGDEADVHGYFTSVSGNTVQVNCGFQPLTVDVVNTTDAITWHWQYGMPASNSVKIVLGTVAGTLDTTSAITVVVDLAGNGNVTFSTGLCGANKNICFHIEG